MTTGTGGESASTGPSKTYGVLREWSGHSLSIWALVLATDVWSDLSPSALATHLGSIAVFMLFAWLLLNVAHDRALCHRCMREIPDSPDTDVERDYAYLFRFHTFVERRTAVIAVAASLVAVSLVLGLTDFGGNVADAAMSLVLGLVVVWVVWLHRVHRRLLPWCPFCRDDGGGFHECGVDDPMPDPAEFGRR